MTRIILIRHGETDFNLTGIYCGASNPPLNKTGIEQAEKLRPHLKGFEIQKVYSSDLKRARETAKILFKDEDIILAPEFREVSFGVFEGLTYSEIIKKYARLYDRWSNDTINVRIPKGENLIDLKRRVKKKLSEIVKECAGKTAAVVTHGGPIRVILCGVLKLGLENFWKIEQGNSALNVIDYPENSAPKAAVVNDVSHLGGEENEKGYLYFGRGPER